MSRALRIAIIASARHAIREPFAGGLESQIWSLAQGLRARGHQVTLFAGSDDTELSGITELHPRWPRISQLAQHDVSMPEPGWLAEHHAYLQVMLELAETGRERFDVVHNNSLHYLPVAMARSVRVPMITTLHTPPTPWLESAIQLGPCPITFVAVSEHTARTWRSSVAEAEAEVILNGVDLHRWRRGPGGGGLIWFGRLVAEKGAHLAIEAARRAGLPLALVGPISDQRYFDEQIRPGLGSTIRYLGHLSHAELCTLVGRAAASLVTPCWDEPYGLVAAESMACGTPVAGFARGGLPEVVDHDGGVLVPAGDVGALAAAAVHAATLCRADVRRRAESHCSITRMLDRYEDLYLRLVRRNAA
jgi:glycosyltransferase involved in cell wall biosynthesis